jgi:predicted 2-oxoglutarate/Fe(II)-dependent dioxygenase YbiX
MIETVMTGVYTIPEVLTPEECSAFIAETEAEGGIATQIGADSGPKMMPDLGNNGAYRRDDPALAAGLWAKVSASVPRMFRGCQAVGLSERFRLYRCDVGERFAPPLDGVPDLDSGHRSHLAFIIHLNEDYEGGETGFRYARIKPQRGMALVFNHELLHEGAPVKKGRKYVLRSDVMFDLPGRVVQS